MRRLALSLALALGMAAAQIPDDHPASRLVDRLMLEAEVIRIDCPPAFVLEDAYTACAAARWGFEHFELGMKIATLGSSIEQVRPWRYDSAVEGEPAGYLAVFTDGRAVVAVGYLLIEDNLFDLVVFFVGAR